MHKSDLFSAQPLFFIKKIATVNVCVVGGVGGDMWCVLDKANLSFELKPTFVLMSNRSFSPTDEFLLNFLQDNISLGSAVTVAAPGKQPSRMYTVKMQNLFICHLYAGKFSSLFFLFFLISIYSNCSVSAMHQFNTTLY